MGKKLILIIAGMTLWLCSYSQENNSEEYKIDTLFKISRHNEIIINGKLIEQRIKNNEIQFPFALLHVDNKGTRIIKYERVNDSVYTMYWIYNDVLIQLSNYNLKESPISICPQFHLLYHDYDVEFPELKGQFGYSEATVKGMKLTRWDTYTFEMGRFVKVSLDPINQEFVTQTITGRKKKKKIRQIRAYIQKKQEYALALKVPEGNIYRISIENTEKK